MSQIVEIRQNGAYALVTWDFGNVCNYSCWYCFPEAHSGTAKTLSDEQVWEFTETIRKHFFSVGKHVYLNLAGGEPTFNCNFPVVAKCIRQDPQGLINLCSNGSKELSWWKSNRNWYDYVVLTYHVAHASMEDFLKVAQFLADEGILSINIVMDSRRWNRCLEAYKRLSTIRGTNVWAKPLLVNSNGQFLLYKYSSEQLEWFRLNENKELDEKQSKNPMEFLKILKNGDCVKFQPGELLLSNQAKFKGWYCFAGFYNIHISYFDEIRTSVCGIKQIGNIKEPLNIAWPIEPIKCDRNQCNCLVDIVIPKRRFIVGQQLLSEKM